MPKAAASGIHGTRLRTKQPASSAGLTGPPTLCVSPDACTSRGKTTTPSVSTRTPEPRPDCSILARRPRLAENQPGRDIPSPSGNMHPEDEEVDKCEWVSEGGDHQFAPGLCAQERRP